MIAATLALLLAPAPALADPGPEPTMEEFIALAEPALEKKLRKSGAVTYQWPYKLIAGPGSYYTCGRSSPKRKTANKPVWMSAAVANGRVISAQWSTLNGMLEWECKQLLKKGTLVPR